jgi:hypothetical protein
MMASKAMAMIALIRSFLRRRTSSAALRSLMSWTSACQRPSGRILALTS